MHKYIIDITILSFFGKIYLLSSLSVEKYLKQALAIWKVQYWPFITSCKWTFISIGYNEKERSFYEVLNDQSCILQETYKI